MTEYVQVIRKNLRKNGEGLADLDFADDIVIMIEDAERVADSHRSPV